MKLVLLSGGSGKRLWPLSNDSRSKQFLKVLKDKDDSLESMVQRVHRQITNFYSDSDIFIATSKNQVEMLNNQLGNKITVLEEPERRDTFPAIALAATYLYSEVGIGLDEVICVLPVDPYVDDKFFEQLPLLENALNCSQAELALIGVKPSYPSEKYGYIVPKKLSEFDFFSEVSHFIEKPNEEFAKELIAKKAYWNCGVFAFKLDKIITKLEEKGLPVIYPQLLSVYSTLIKTSFDYEVVEQTNNIIFIPYEGEWKDLGTWNTLTEEMKFNVLGNGTMCDESNNTHLINELDIPVKIIGINDAIVAVSSDGILISDKEKSPKIKDHISNLDQRVMYAERKWGYYRVLDYTKFNNQEVLTRRIVINPGSFLSYQYHLKRKEIWTVLTGEAESILNGKRITLTPGSVLEIKPGELHALKAHNNFEMIEVQIGEELIDEDIYRVCTEWEDIKKQKYITSR
ncbi:mannose-1-phosphate guanylyltransferase [Neobacillus piezotolerans]|uniref:Mannose-1-phosphate guanylyltransferase n=1 Tax=Neobacillus piezotolerans TaxID=2259171 RepID=A0A3D8GSZ2_9BACI|nr:sugar phosphate nucleotidyltransferase [Neobacillus piezotolerans]RDU37558.1 mannose-1-phosphate guanylyltransferase [Neobacillus piezotolerans]